MEDKPRNLKELLAEAKNLSELMVDIAYAALFFGDPDMGEEVSKLEQEMSDLVQEMRKLCIMAVRDPREAEAMAAVLQVVSAIERIANDAEDIAAIPIRRWGIPEELLANLSQAVEVSHRVQVQENSDMAHSSLAALELPVAVGMRIMAVRRQTKWLTDVDGSLVLLPGDALILRGPPEGIQELRRLAAVSKWVTPQPKSQSKSLPESPSAEPSSDNTWLTDLDRAAELLVEMKNLSEAAVGLAYSALVYNDRELASEVSHLEGRLDEMNAKLQLWVLRAGNESLDPSQLRGLLMLAAAAEDIGDQARQMVWLVERGDEVHPIVGMALGESDDVVFRLQVRQGSPADNKTLKGLALTTEPGFMVLAIRRGDKYVHPPQGWHSLQSGDEIIAHGPEEGRESLASYFGWVFQRDEETGEHELMPTSMASMK